MLNSQDMRHLRREMQIVFQNPYGSLDARQTIGSAIMEPMKIHGLGGGDGQRRSRTANLLERVGLNASAMTKMPHEFSGGQRQRVCIARTLACEPKLIICDESVSALDVIGSSPSTQSVERSSTRVQSHLYFHFAPILAW